ncbi:hypothetical protein DACRYDRAFT_116015 [Dacryopinax primogenitus]|uniref:Uncharacterized protein n=1 Tax=Dacryopinax primogenitus (strain DJM 731) TaxID=1858805 RepID=M5G8U7_DACPD|nr:uncharacterized protein DACRYDRAFT_116015 [Dacryopinax primogenitus]EJU02287.1 hypothetical protein DACRYDRAFT_116015 [Dacryopinax primogenitus]
MPGTQTPPSPRRAFTPAELFQGLQELDKRLYRQFGNVPKVKIVVAGGFVVCSRWCTRPTTRGCDYIRPKAPAPPDFKWTMWQMSLCIAHQWNWTTDWFSDKFSMFLPEDENEEPSQKFLDECIQQGAIVFDGQVLQAFAVKWEWALASTIDRVYDEEVRAPSHCLQDGVFFLRELILRRSGKPIKWIEFRKLCSAYYDIHPLHLAEAARYLAIAYEKQFGTVAILIS